MQKRAPILFSKLSIYVLALLIGWRLYADEPTGDQIRRLFASKQRSERMVAIQNAHKLGEAAIPWLEAVFLKDGAESHYAMFREERLCALEALGRIGGSQIAPVVLLAAGDLEQPVREAARRLLLSLPETQAEKIRTRWIYAEDWFVRQGSLIALREMDVSAEELVREASVKLRKRQDPDRLAAVQLLGQLESRAAIEPLRDVIEDSTESLSLRLEALGALHYLDGSAVPLAVWPLALGEEGMRSLYMATLSGVHIAMSYLEAAGVRALPTLIQTLSSPDALKRMRAAQVLGKIGPAAASACRELESLCADPARFVADEAHRALALIRQNSEAPPKQATSDFLEQPAVQIEDRGAVFALSNGLVALEVDKAKGTLVSLQKAGDARNLFGPKGAWYSTFPWTLPRGMGVPAFVEKTARVVRSTPDLVEVAVRLALEKPRPLVLEHHYVLRRGVSGVYRFAVLEKPAESEIPKDSILDYALFMKVDAHVFDHAAVSDTLQGRLQSPEKAAELQSRMRELSNATERLPDGRIWAKYSWCAYEQETKVHGVSGPGVGLWVIIPNDESGYNLPSCYPGTVHEAGESIVLVTHQEGTPHTIGAEQRANVQEPPWKKLYGPTLLYLNAGANHAEMWADAKRQAETESAAHPAAWMEHPLYPRERARVEGQVLRPDGSPAARAWVMVCTPHPHPDRAWQRHLGPYIWRGWTDAQGHFSIPGIRPGSYSVLARVDGILGNARMDAVTFQPGQTRALALMTIREERSGKLLWQIGNPDGTPREFFGAVDSHEWSGWIRNYRRLFPNDVRFFVGKSDPARDWYYCQPSGWPQGYGAQPQPTEWRIDFDLDAVPQNGVQLTIGVAATRGGDLKLHCNQNALAPIKIDESDFRTALCMAPDRGAYTGFRTERVLIPVDHLRAGSNTLTLRFGPGNSRFASIMYDFLRLEAVALKIP